MDLLALRKKPSLHQYFIGVGIIAFWMILGAFAVTFVGPTSIAMVLLLTVAILTVLIDIGPVFVTSLLAALGWNFFFLPPRFTFHISQPEDFALFLIFIALSVVSLLISRIYRKNLEQERMEKEQAQSILLYQTLFGSLSHELRTPITAIIGANDTLMNSDRLSDESRKELHQVIHVSSERLKQQIENLLQINRLESGIIQPHNAWHDVHDLLRQSIELSMVPGIKVQQHIADHIPLIWTDTGLLCIALGNLIRNAHDHAINSPNIQLIASWQSDHFEFIVRDQGPAIPADKQELVFQKFARIHTQQAGHSGLGLAIVKGFVQCIGGEVKLIRNQQNGNDFIIVLQSKSSHIQALHHE